jgi:hypothetical protein
MGSCWYCIDEDVYGCYYSDGTNKKNHLKDCCSNNPFLKTSVFGKLMS